MGKVVFADRDATVHVKFGESQKNDDGSDYQPTESVVLKAGETIPVERVPNYLKDLITQGKAPGLSLRTDLQVKKALREAALVRGDLSALEEEVEEVPEDEDTTE